MCPSHSQRTKQPTLSVIVVTRNRVDKLQRCIEAILRNTHLPEEIIIINEGDEPIRLPNPSTKRCPIQVYDLQQANLSMGRNLGLKHAKGEIVCFTDDDCIVDVNWIAAIKTAFICHSDCAAVFGDVQPYLPTRQRKDDYCPCVFQSTHEVIITKPEYHDDRIGYGNNMAFRKSVLEDEDLHFQTWLGAGSIGQSAEDADIALRLLVSKHSVLHAPSCQVSHDRWLSQAETSAQEKKYLCGQAACYGYFAFRGHLFGWRVLHRSVSDLYWWLRGELKKSWNRRNIWQGIQSLYGCFKLGLAFVKGLLIACWQLITSKGLAD